MIRVNGLNNILRRANAIRHRMDGDIEQAVVESCADLLGESQPLVPVDTGALRGSGSYKVEERRHSIDGTVGYNTPYALKVHEDLTMHHPNGGQAKFLTEPFDHRKEQYRRHIMEAARGVL